MQKDNFDFDEENACIEDVPTHGSVIAAVSAMLAAEEQQEQQKQQENDAAKLSIEATISENDNQNNKIDDNRNAQQADELIDNRTAKESISTTGDIDTADDTIKTLDDASDIVSEGTADNSDTQSVMNDAAKYGINDIWCIMGKSASGKDSVYKQVLRELKTLGDLDKMSPVILYTTRPKRSGEENGREYFFVSTEKLDEMSRNNELIERRDYNTENGIWSYALADDHQLTSGKALILIEPPNGVRALLRWFGSNRIHPIYIRVDDGERLERALTRERQQLYPNYEEMCRRFLSDTVDFDGAEFITNTISIDNIDFNDTVKEIVALIHKSLNRNEKENNDDNNEKIETNKN